MAQAHSNLLFSIYHGVKTEEGVLMRMNAIPRAIAEMGERRGQETAGTGQLF